jgi:imidazole glycerol phosphate synthase glutamine amidotransferase subunit
VSDVIGIVNYGIAGNIHSVKKAIERADGKTLVINKPSDFNLVDKLVIPGVGSFKDAMQELESDNFIESIQEFDKPILGICLGMQIMADLGFEFGKAKGLGLIEAEVKPILCDGKIPHMGFNRINIKTPNILLDGVENEEFYFMHSYEMVNYTDIAALTKYNNHSFVSAIHKENLYGVQFHPEKSREAGIRLLSNFIKL